MAGSSSSQAGNMGIYFSDYPDLLFDYYPLSISTPKVTPYFSNYPSYLVMK
jgi:hypothetical protein